MLCEALSHSFIFEATVEGGDLKLLISRNSISNFYCVGLFLDFSWRNAIYSKKLHLCNFDAVAPDFVSSLSLSRHFCKVPFKFFSCFFKTSTKTNENIFKPNNELKVVDTLRICRLVRNWIII